MIIIFFISQANVVCEVDKPANLVTDKFWLYMDGPPALADLTQIQKMTKYDLIVLHHQLITTLYLTVQHSLRNVKPFAYFDEKVSNFFFFLGYLNNLYNIKQNLKKGRGENNKKNFNLQPLESIPRFGSTPVSQGRGGILSLNYTVSNIYKAVNRAKFFYSHNVLSNMKAINLGFHLPPCLTTGNLIKTWGKW